MAWAAPTATLLKKQKPMAAWRSAWWPGGRTAQKAAWCLSLMTRSTPGGGAGGAQRGVQRAAAHGGVAVDPGQARPAALGAASKIMST
jgi:hypothetical protein